jgi:hypothetical protein
VGDHLLGNHWVWATNNIRLDLIKMHRSGVNLGGNLVDLLNVGQDFHPEVPQHFPRNRSRRDSADGLPSRGPSAPGDRPNTVLLVVREISVTRSVLLSHFGVVVTTLIGISDQERDWCPKRKTVFDAAQNLNLIRFLSLGDN